MNDSNDIGDGKEELGMLLFIVGLHYPWSGIVLLEGRLSSVVNVKGNFFVN